jgi:glycosyltransferase involved in cell wall biosynthesis
MLLWVVEKKHRVLQFIVGLGVGGAEVALLRSSRELKKRGHDIRVLALKRLTQLEAAFRAEGIAVYYFADLLKIPSQFSELRKWAPEILLAWMPHSHLASIGLRRALGANALVWNVRQTLNRREQIPLSTWLLIKSCARLSRTTDAIIYNSEQGEFDHKAIGYLAPKQTVIPNGFSVPSLSSSEEIASLKAEEGLSQDLPVITFVGRNHPDKGARFFLEAATEFLKGHQAEFCIVGAGFESMREKNQEPSIHFLGTRNESRLANIYRVTDIITSSSISEGFPNAIGEAMSNGNYPVVTNVGDSAKIVGNFGTVVEPGDSKKICEAWLKFLSLPDQQKQNLKRNARERIQSEYSLTSVIEKYEDLFDAVCKH